MPKLAIVVTVISICTSVRAGSRFGVNLPAGVELVAERSDKDGEGREVSIVLYASRKSYASVTAHFKKTFAGAKTVTLRERVESIDARYVVDPNDASTSVQVFTAINTNFGDAWDALFVRAVKGGTIVAVRQRKPPRSLRAKAPSAELFIPRAVIEIDSYDAIDDLREEYLKGR